MMMTKLKRDGLTFGLGLAVAVAAIATIAMTVDERTPATAPRADITVSYNDGSTDCSVITLSPDADRDTIGAALRDAALFVEDAGCINIRFDPAQPRHWHGVALAKDMAQ